IFSRDWSSDVCSSDLFRGARMKTLSLIQPTDPFPGFAAGMRFCRGLAILAIASLIGLLPMGCALRPADPPRLLFVVPQELPNGEIGRAAGRGKRQPCV